MHILIESHIPFIKGYAERAGHSVEYLEPQEFTPERVRNADALIIRTRTRCDAALLEGSRVSHIATATIGTDHIDLDYCRRRGIAVSNAPGCNAPAVAQYVLSVVGRLKPDCRRLGVVGVGHVGRIVVRWAEANGIECLQCDPPRAAREGQGAFVTLREIAEECDVITFHTPLNEETRHMVNAPFLESLKEGTLLINAARGAVVYTPALLGCQKPLRYAIDCWEGEPEISTELLAKAEVATPHIAGYSLKGKRRATAMALRAIDPSIDLPIDPVTESPTIDSIISSYDPLIDTAALKSNPSAFEALRNNYSYRKEPI